MTSWSVESWNSVQHWKTKTFGRSYGGRGERKWTELVVAWIMVRNHEVPPNPGKETQKWDLGKKGWPKNPTILGREGRWC